MNQGWVLDIWFHLMSNEEVTFWIINVIEMDWKKKNKRHATLYELLAFKTTDEL